MAKCQDCNSIKIFPGTNEGDGKCSTCHGTGNGDLLDQVVHGLLWGKSECQVCKGSGVCQTCGGTGIVDD